MFLSPSKVYGAARRQTFGHLSPTLICQQFPLLNILSLLVVFDTGILVIQIQTLFLEGPFMWCESSDRQYCLL